MSTAKYEKLIDLILNEDQERAEQLFHEIVVEQSRAIYESLMDEESGVGDLHRELEAESVGSDDMMEADDEMDMDDGMDMGDEESADGEMDMDDEEDEEMDMGDESEGEPATKDDIMNLEDKLDELMAEFESMMHGGDEEEPAPMSDEEDSEEVMESVDLQAAPKAKHEDHKAKSPVAANAGGKGSVGAHVKPVHTQGTESVPTGPKAPSNAYTKGQGNLPGAGSFKNTVAGAGKLSKGQGEAAPTPKNEDHKAKSPVAESKKATKRIVK